MVKLLSRPYLRSVTMPKACDINLCLGNRAEQRLANVSVGPRRRIPMGTTKEREWPSAGRKRCGPAEKCRRLQRFLFTEELVAKT
jgi:hypothetical protein